MPTLFRSTNINIKYLILNISPRTQDGHVQVLVRWTGSQCPPTHSTHAPHTLLTQVHMFTDSELHDTALVLRTYSGSLPCGPSPQSVSDVAVNELPSCLYMHFSKGKCLQRWKRAQLWFCNNIPSLFFNSS